MHFSMSRLHKKIFHPLEDILSPSVPSSRLATGLEWQLPGHSYREQLSAEQAASSLFRNRLLHAAVTHSLIQKINRDSFESFSRQLCEQDMYRQDRTIRRIAQGGSRDHTNPLFRKFSSQKFQDFIKVREPRFFVHKSLSHTFFGYFYRFNSHTNNEVHCYSTRYANHIHHHPSVTRNLWSVQSANTCQPCLEFPPPSICSLPPIQKKSLFSIMEYIYCIFVGNVCYYL